ncbi:hypothetical protein GQP97_001077 [Escherichia coli]|uniref:hypothetical protein n=1 Tax=Escherichia coli TaxID=562 RepID=UPI002882F013|nr:hypothetical protein [Escherichia coli]ELM4766394.1 hypothetical protein [Salmonella enterica]HDX8191388.1 hypothetical protein [Salmonella enterica subsp. enterica serovar Typhimurium]EEQ3928738.1 hypothetical protein [Escherichia coli]EEQ9665077.1 hypothetical protein [Escherichia coli]EJB8813284.1 hypothetical protein [Escherichia coli]
MNSEPNKQGCNRADEVKKESQCCNKDDELAQLLANLEITDSALYLSNERIEEIASTDSDAEKRHQVYCKIRKRISKSFFLALPVCHRDIFLLLDYVQIRAVAL